MVKSKYIGTSYVEAAQFLSGRDDVAIAHNTRLVRRPGYIAVRHHYTDVVQYWPDGRITLSTGGWYSTTTKQRINQFSDAGVYQQNWDWYLRDGRDYYDGVTL